MIDDADTLDLQAKLWEWCDQAKGGGSAEHRSMAASLIIQWLPRFLRPPEAPIDLRIAEAQQAFLRANHTYLVAVMDYAQARASTDSVQRVQARGLHEEAQRLLNLVLASELKLKALEGQRETEAKKAQEAKR